MKEMKAVKVLYVTQTYTKVDVEMTIVNVLVQDLQEVKQHGKLQREVYKYELYEMRPVKQTPAHHTDKFAELVCSNSFTGKHINKCSRCY